MFYELDHMTNWPEAALVSLRKILRATELNTKSVARSSGLTPSQLIVLHLLDGMQRATAGEIARAASVGQATVTALVDKLVERGFVERKREATDRRRVWVAITPEGRRALEGAPDLLHNVFQSRFEQLESWEQAFVVAALERVASLLDADKMDAAPVLTSAVLTDGYQAPGAANANASGPVNGKTGS